MNKGTFTVVHLSHQPRLAYPHSSATDALPAALQVGASGDPKQLKAILDMSMVAEATRRNARPRYELPIEDGVLLSIDSLRVIVCHQVLRQREPRLQRAGSQAGRWGSSRTRAGMLHRR